MTEATTKEGSKMSRRNFLKGVAAVAGAALVGCTPEQEFRQYIDIKVRVNDPDNLLTSPDGKYKEGSFGIECTKGEYVVQSLDRPYGIIKIPLLSPPGQLETIKVPKMAEYVSITPLSLDGSDYHDWWRRNESPKTKVYKDGRELVVVVRKRAEQPVSTPK